MSELGASSRVDWAVGGSSWTILDVDESDALAPFHQVSKNNQQLQGGEAGERGGKAAAEGSSSTPGATGLKANFRRKLALDG